MLLETILQNLETEGLFKNSPRPHVVLAYSGGVDSTALLLALAELRKKHPLQITAAYFNHAWRGDVAEELPLIHQNCLGLDISLVLIQADRTLSKTEATAREHRYRQLTSLTHNLKADALLTAHHADDQIETVLFRILRGTGVNGLSGIHRRLVLEAEYGKPVPILRPLLDIPKETLTAYVSEQHVPFFSDPTNTDVRIQRNQLRNEILPFLEQKFPQVKNALFRLGLVTEGDVEILEEKIDGIWRTLHKQDERGAYLNALLFNQMSVPYQRRLLKRFLHDHHIVTDFQEIEELLTFIRGEGRENLSAALKSLEKTTAGKTRFLSLYKNQLRVLVTPESKEIKQPVPVRIPGENTVPERGVTLRAVSMSEKERQVKMTPIRANDTHQVFVDLSRYGNKPLELRTRKPGDKFKPMGMDVPMRFKKFLINRGIPRFDRNNLLLLAHGQEILWAPGLGISQDLKIEKSPTHLLKLEYADEPPRLTPVLLPEGSDTPRFNPMIPRDDDEDEDEDETPGSEVLDDTDVAAETESTETDILEPDADDDF